MAERKRDRPKRFARWDVHFADLPLGMDMFDRFGPAGVVLFLGFICACKKNHIPGRMSYASERECLSVLGWPDLEFVNNRGEPFTLEEFWTWLGHRKQVRRTRRGRLTNVHSTRWGQWQKDWNRADDAERKAAQRAHERGVDTPQTSSGHAADVTQTRSGHALDTLGTRNGDAQSSRSDAVSTPDRSVTDLDLDLDLDLDHEEEKTPATDSQDPWSDENHNNHAVLAARDNIRQLFKPRDA